MSNLLSVIKALTAVGVLIFIVEIITHVSH